MTTHDAELSAQLDDLLARLQVAGIQHAVLLGADGLLIGCSPSTGQELAERLAAACAGMYALGASVTVPEGMKPVRRVLIDFHDEEFLFIRAAGAGSRLAVLTDGTADPATVAELADQLITQFQPALAALVSHRRR